LPAAKRRGNPKGCLLQWGSALDRFAGARNGKSEPWAQSARPAFFRKRAGVSQLPFAKARRGATEPACRPHPSLPAAKRRGNPKGCLLQWGSALDCFAGARNGEREPWAQSFRERARISQLPFAKARRGAASFHSFLLIFFYDGVMFKA
jgi:hypothetical protein